MANVNVSADQILPQAGSDNSGRRISVVSGSTKAAQNDTLTVLNASTVSSVYLVIDASGVHEPVTVSGNVITLTSVTTGTVSGTIIYN